MPMIRDVTSLYDAATQKNYSTVIAPFALRLVHLLDYKKEQHCDVNDRSGGNRDCEPQ
jgi:hypothetical protein